MVSSAGVPLSVLQLGSSLPCCSQPHRKQTERTAILPRWPQSPRQQSINPALPRPLLPLSFAASICLPVHILWQNGGRNSVTHSLPFLPPSPFASPSFNSFLTQ